MTYEDLQTRIAQLEAENAALKQALGLHNQEPPEPGPCVPRIAAVASAFAAELIRQRLASGGRVEIPSLNIVIEPNEDGEA